MFVDLLYKRMWVVAEQLSELEAAQFEKKPYAERIVVPYNCGCEPFIKYDDVTREQYKDQQRQKHIWNMMEMCTDSSADVDSVREEVDD